MQLAGTDPLLAIWATVAALYGDGEDGVGARTVLVHVGGSHMAYAHSNMCVYYTYDCHQPIITSKVRLVRHMQVLLSRLSIQTVRITISHLAAQSLLLPHGHHSKTWSLLCDSGTEKLCPEPAMHYNFL